MIDQDWIDALGTRDRKLERDNVLFWGACCSGRHRCRAKQIVEGGHIDKRGIRWLHLRCDGCPHRWQETATVQVYNAFAPIQAVLPLEAGT